MSSVFAPLALRGGSGHPGGPGDARGAAVQGPPSATDLHNENAATWRVAERLCARFEALFRDRWFRDPRTEREAIRHAASVEAALGGCRSQQGTGEAAWRRLAERRERLADAQFFLACLGKGDTVAVPAGWDAGRHAAAAALRRFNALAARVEERAGPAAIGRFDRALKVARFAFVHDNWLVYKAASAWASRIMKGMLAAEERAPAPRDRR